MALSYFSARTSCVGDGGGEPPLFRLQRDMTLAAQYVWERTKAEINNSPLNASWTSLSCSITMFVGSEVSLAKSCLGVWRLLHSARRGLVVSKTLSKPRRYNSYLSSGPSMTFFSRGHTRGIRTIHGMIIRDLMEPSKSCNLALRIHAAEPPPLPFLIRQPRLLTVERGGRGRWRKTA